MTSSKILGMLESLKLWVWLRGDEVSVHVTMTFQAHVQTSALVCRHSAGLHPHPEHP